MHIYLDNNATTALDERVFEAMKPYFLTHFFNASSSHLDGMYISECIENATAEIASYLNVKPNQITFNSGATEGLNTIIKSLIFQEKRHVLSVKTEHSAVLDSLVFLERQGFQVDLLNVNSSGEISTEDLEKSLKNDTALLIVMLANNETGIVHDVKNISEIAHQKGVKVLCDATQAFGKINVDVKNLDVDYLVLSGHKFYGPKGVGALYFKNPDFEPLIHGGGQQRNLRSGTLNVPGIIGLSEALKYAVNEISSETEKLRDYLEEELLKIPNTFVNGKGNRLPNTTNICFSGVESSQLIMALKHISVSSGSACSSVTSTPSHVLKAMGLSDADALSSIRFSLSKFTTEEEIKIASAKVEKLVSYFRNIT